MNALPASYRRVSKHDPCPICGRPDWCAIRNDDAVLCMRTASAHAARAGGWWHRLPDGDAPPLRLVAPPARPTVDAAFADRAYRALLAAAPLADRHRADLRRRGLDDAQIAAAGYGSLPGDARAR